MIEVTRNIKIDILQGRYKATSAYSIPKDPHTWHECPVCGLRPLVWEYNNGSSTACGCGDSIYRHHSIHTESIMSYVTRNNGSALGYSHEKLKSNWNYWCKTGVALETWEELRKEGKW